MTLRLHNTLTKKTEAFKPQDKDEVKIYTCGPTVYDYQHIGNYSGYIYWDVLIRLLKVQGLEIKRVLNITDVGHLVGDGDEGEDKLEKGAQREGKTARQVADYYTTDFFKSFNKLALLEPELYAMATDYIPQQIDMVKLLLEKGFAYKSAQAIYFDVSKLGDYGKLTGQKLSDKEVGARAEVVTDAAKHHPQDFALWFFTVGRFAEHEMHWPSPWGDGFPGWHIECSAIVHATLGETIDIHTGGVDHIGTHHTNEIAQTEAAFGKQLSSFWLHNNHMMVNDKKISKSLANGLTLADLAKKGFSATDFKMLVLQSHYRSQSNFTWDGLQAAQTRLKEMQNLAAIGLQRPVKSPAHITSKMLFTARKEIEAALGDDLNTPIALAALSEVASQAKHGLWKADIKPFNDFIEWLDNLLALGLKNIADISEEENSMILEREKARAAKNWKKSDTLRDKLTAQGIGLNDTGNGTIWYRL